MRIRRNVVRNEVGVMTGGRARVAHDVAPCPHGCNVTCNNESSSKNYRRQALLVLYICSERSWSNADDLSLLRWNTRSYFVAQHGYRGCIGDEFGAYCTWEAPRV
jgi:hypothetical protein